MALLFVGSFGLALYLLGSRRLVAFAFVLVAGSVAAGLVLHRPSADRIVLSEETPLEVETDTSRRTLLVAIDGLTWERLYPMAQEGRLPRLASLMTEGAFGILHSYPTRRPSNDETGYWSPVVWTTLATGLPVSEHGIDDFGILDEDTGRRTRAKSWHRKAPAFWDLFSAFGRTVGVVGWWATWPAEDVHGVLASSGLGLRGNRELPGLSVEAEGWFGELEGLTHPPEFVAEISQDVGVPRDVAAFLHEEIFPVDKYPLLLTEADLRTIQSVLWQDQLYHDIALHLLETRDLDLVSVYYEGFDVLGHHFWRYMDFPEDTPFDRVFYNPPRDESHRRIVDRYLEVLDGYLGELLDRAGDDATVVVVSDHGFTTVEDHPSHADHSPYGVFLARGRGIREGYDLNLSLRGVAQSTVYGDVTVFDVLPTLMYLHDLPVSEELPGEVLERIVEPSYLDDHPIRTVPTYGDFAEDREVDIRSGEVDEEEYRERLKSLGYL